MKKEASKKQGAPKEYTGDDVKRYLGSLAEDFQHKVSAIGEQFGGLNKKLDNHGKMLTEHGRILLEHGRILADHGRILNSHTEMIGKLAEDMTEVKKDIQEIKTDLKQKVDRSEFARLERRVIALENRR